MLLSAFLAQYGDVDRDAGIELAQVAELAQTLDRKGSVTVKFTVEKTGSRVIVNVGTDTKPPKPDPEAGLWHIGPDGLSKDDPYQTRIDHVTGEVIEARYPRKD